MNDREIEVKKLQIYKGCVEAAKRQDKLFDRISGERGIEQSAGLYMAHALALLTSPVKAEREEAKALIRQWRHQIIEPV